MSESQESQEAEAPRSWPIAFCIVSIILALCVWGYVVWYVTTRPPRLPIMANPELPAEGPLEPAPTILRAQKVEEHISARLLIVDGKVIPYDMLLIHADGAKVRNRHTGEEFTVIFDQGLRTTTP